jgi:hypothetical protein
LPDEFILTFWREFFFYLLLFANSETFTIALKKLAVANLTISAMINDTQPAICLPNHLNLMIGFVNAGPAPALMAKFKIIYFEGYDIRVAWI